MLNFEINIYKIIDNNYKLLITLLFFIQLLGFFYNVNIIDGTITTKDSMIEFIIFTFGWISTIAGGFKLTPILVAYKLGLVSNKKFDEIVKLKKMI